MKLFNKVTIIGVGLIGGSIGLAIKKKKLANTVVGVCRRKISAKAALKHKAVDIATLNYKEGLKDADLVIIATPVGRIVDIAKKVAKYAKKEIILIDIGSTKEIIVKQIEKIIPRNIKFVGTHTMAGSEKSGVGAAHKELFEDSICILTKTRKTDIKAFNRVKTFWDKLGSRCKQLTPSEHDRCISFVSHLPHVVAIALTVAADPKSIQYASTGFKDTTRIASSNPSLWQDIFMTNKNALLASLDNYISTLEGLRSSIKRSDVKFLTKKLKKAKAIRDKLD